MEREAYWRKVVEIKYGSSGWCTEEGHGSYGVSVWKSIHKELGALCHSYLIGLVLEIMCSFGMIFGAMACPLRCCT